MTKSIESKIEAIDKKIDQIRKTIRPIIKEGKIAMIDMTILCISAFVSIGAGTYQLARFIIRLTGTDA